MKTATAYLEKSASKKELVRTMFDGIANKYDFLNHFLSLGIDKSWRRKAIRILEKENPKKILDVATGTADFAIETLKLKPELITGIDISERMLAIGKEKIRNLKSERSIHLENGDAENISFSENTFDAVTVAFGVRNFENLNSGLKEIHRVLKPNGMLVILEFSHPEKFPVKQLFKFYFHNILPLLGKIISSDRKAYQYLPDSVKEFPSGNKFLQILTETGFTDTKFYPLTFGIAAIYTAKK